MPRKSRPCPVCVSIKRKPIGNITTWGAVRCSKCYRERVGIPTEKRPDSKCACGQPKAYRAKTCQACYQSRGPSEKPLQSPPTTETTFLHEPLTTFDQAWKLWQSCIGQSKDRYKKAQRPKPAGKTRRITVLPDLHVPHHDKKLFAKFLAMTVDTTDVLVCIGDLSDSASVSAYPPDPESRALTFAEEWAECQIVLDTLSESYKEVHVILGNHDVRLRRQLARKLSPDMLAAISSMTPQGTLSPITAQIRARRYPNVKIANHPIPDSTMTLDWLTTIDGSDALFAHPERYSKVAGRALRDFRDWCQSHTESLGLDDVRCYLIGHTHMMSMFPSSSDGKKLLVEVGNLAKTAGYQIQPKYAGSNSSKGFCQLVQHRGRDGKFKTDLNSVRLHCFDFTEPWNT